MNFTKKLTEFSHLPFIEELKNIFFQMEAGYDFVAEQYGFNCTGCEDNCCLTRFYHHTLLEHIYIEQGFNTLDKDLREEVIAKAEDVITKTESADLKGQPVRFMCPLNFDGKCILYDYRPMVCRLHGLAHELVKPGQPPVRSVGCELFTKQTENIEYIKFDRTPHYIELAKLEGKIRVASGFMEKTKNTIAEMLII